MDTTLTIGANKATSNAVFVPAQRQEQLDTKVPPIKGLDPSAVLPPEKQFVAQVVTARLSGTAFPENPGEIAPPHRTLRPYNVPMLPYDKEEPMAETEDDDQVKQVTKTEQDEPTAPAEPAIASTPDGPPDEIAASVQDVAPREDDGVTPDES